MSDFVEFAAETAVESPDYARADLLDTEVTILVEALRNNIESEPDKYVDHKTSQVMTFSGIDDTWINTEPHAK